MSKESKFLSRVLRHEPELVGLTLGTGGWVLVDDLLRGMKKAGLAKPSCPTLSNQRRRRAPLFR